MSTGVIEEAIQHNGLVTDIAARTRQLQAVIDQVARQGGGVVRVSPGLWEITTLSLRSGVRLHLEAGAVLQAARDLSLYPRFTNEVDNKDQSTFHLLHAVDCCDISLTGEGIVDGQDSVFWSPCEREEQRPYGIFKYFVPGERLSPLIQLVCCTRVRVEGVTIRRAPGWTLHCYDCDEVWIDRVRIRNDLFGPNTDGIGITDSRDVHIRGCDLICGDDAVIIKSTQRDKGSERIIVTDCVAETNCAAFGIGAEVAGTIRDIIFSNCIARASLRILTIQLWDDGTVENVVFSNIVGKTFPSPGVFCERPIYIDVQQFERLTGTLGVVRNIQFSNIACKTRGRILLTAQDGAYLEDIVLRDVHLDIPEVEDPWEVVPKARSRQLSNFNPETRAARAAAVFDNIRGLHLDEITVRWPGQVSVPMHGLWCRNVSQAKINSPRLTASRPDMEHFVLINSSVS